MAVEYANKPCAPVVRITTTVRMQETSEHPVVFGPTGRGIAVAVGTLVQKHIEEYQGLASKDKGMGQLERIVIDTKQLEIGNEFDE